MAKSKRKIKLHKPTLEHCLGLCEFIEKQLHESMLTKKPGSKKARTLADSSLGAGACAHVIRSAINGSDNHG